MVGLEDFDLQGVCGNLFVEDRLGIECAVIIADTGVIAADDEMGRAHVLPEVGMQHRLARSGVEHVEAVARHHGAVGREIELDHLADRRIPHRCRDIAGLEFAEQHVDHQAVAIEPRHGHVTQLLVGEVHGVAGLEGDDALPTALGDLVADLHGGAEGVREIVLEVGEMQDLDGARDREPTLAVERLDARMLRVGGAVDLLGHQRHLRVAHLLDRLDIHHGEYRIALDIGVAQGDPLGPGDPVGALEQAENRHREEAPVGGPHPLGHGDGVGDIHEAGQRTKIPAAQHHGIGGRLRTDNDRRQGLGLAHQGMVGIRVVDEQRLQSLGTDRFDHLLPLLVGSIARLSMLDRGGR